MTADFPDFLPGVGATGQIIQVASGTATGIAAGASSSFGPFPVSGTGWELRALVQDQVSAVAVSDAEIRLQWSDSASGVTLFEEAWDVAAGPAGSGHDISGHGPTTGNQVTLKLTNQAASADAVTIIYRLWQTSRLYTNSDLRTRTPNGAGWTLSSASMPEGILGNTNAAAVATGASVTRLLPLYQGQVDIAAHTASGTSDLELLIQGISAGVMPNTQTILDDFSDAHGNYNRSWALPGVQCKLVLTNHNAGAQTLLAAVLCSFERT